MTLSGLGGPQAGSGKVAAIVIALIITAAQAHHESEKSYKERQLVDLG
jgi:hypothetical protein